ncbi:MAG TPA: FAD:protein FMN transferase, partial [Candidatus Sphingobacterium stercoripullorum]|nr:FAD:protein FMN transferase [Candidatus Sphingobacterium stercoripullorum]
MRLNKIIGIFTCVILGLQLTHGNNGEPQRYEIGGVTQGTTYKIVYYADKPQIRQNQIDALLERIDKSMSLYRDDSKITRFNDSSVQKLRLDTDMVKVIEEAFKV